MAIDNGIRDWGTRKLLDELRWAWGKSALSQLLLWNTPPDITVDVTTGLLGLLRAAEAESNVSKSVRVALLALARVVDGVVLEEVKSHESKHGKGTALPLLDDRHLQDGLVRSIAQMWLAHIRHILMPHAFALLRILVHVCFGRSEDDVTAAFKVVVQPSGMPANLASLLTVHISGVYAMEQLLRMLLRCSWFALAQLSVPALYDVSGKTPTSPVTSAALQPSSPFDLSRWVASVSVDTTTASARTGTADLQVQPQCASISGSALTILTPALHEEVVRSTPELNEFASKNLLVINSELTLPGHKLIPPCDMACLAHVADLLLQRFSSAAHGPSYECHNVELKYHAGLARLEGLASLIVHQLTPLLPFPAPTSSAVLVETPADDSDLPSSSPGANELQTHRRTHTGKPDSESGASVASTRPPLFEAQLHRRSLHRAQAASRSKEAAHSTGSTAASSTAASSTTSASDRQSGRIPESIMLPVAPHTPYAGSHRASPLSEEPESRAAVTAKSEPLRARPGTKRARDAGPTDDSDSEAGEVVVEPTPQEPASASAPSFNIPQSATRGRQRRRQRPRINANSESDAEVSERGVSAMRRSSRAPAPRRLSEVNGDVTGARPQSDRRPAREHRPTSRMDC